MHELSLALNIVDLAEEEARKAGSERISEVCIEIGQLAGVDRDALEFALEIAKQNTMLEHCLLNISATTGKGYCKNCTREFAMDNLLMTCPVCNYHPVELTDGDRLRLVSLTVE